MTLVIVAELDRLAGEMRQHDDAGVLTAASWLIQRLLADLARAQGRSEQETATMQGLEIR